MINLNVDFNGLLDDLKANRYGYADILDALRKEETGENRKPVIIALRRALDGSTNLDAGNILRAIRAAETRRRRRIVNKIYNTNPIWMWDEIRKHYPGYTEEMLATDLYKPKKVRRCQTSPERESFRSRQISKLYDALKYGHDKLSENQVANLIANHINNFGKRLYYTIDKGNESVTYSFKARETEDNVKKFLSEVANCRTIAEVNALYDGVINVKFGK